jgi:protocatechuate 3,4-dioxygenase alpha subunit
MPVKYLIETASQTAGPFLHIGMVPSAAGIATTKDLVSNVLVSAKTKGERIRVEGHVIDGAGTPVKDAQIELWQANAAGKYNHPADTQKKPVDPAFKGFGRAVTDYKTGLYSFETIKPGPVMGRNGRVMAPHLNVAVFARGINIHLNTRMYFADEADANAKDPVMALIEQPARRDTLIAKRGEKKKAVIYRFDIVLQGDNETVFFDI